MREERAELGFLGARCYGVEANPGSAGVGEWYEVVPDEKEPAAVRAAMAVARGLARAVEVRLSSSMTAAEL